MFEEKCMYYMEQGLNIIRFIAYYSVYLLIYVSIAVLPMYTAAQAACYINYWCIWKEYGWQDWALVMYIFYGICANIGLDTLLPLCVWICYLFLPNNDIMTWDNLFTWMAWAHFINVWIKVKPESTMWYYYMTVDLAKFLKFYAVILLFDLLAQDLFYNSK